MLINGFRDDLREFARYFGTRKAWLGAKEEVHPNRWQSKQAVETLVGPKVLQDLPKKLGRADIFEEFEHGDPLQGLLWTMAWGYNSTGNGAGRFDYQLGNSSPEKVATSIEKLMQLAASGALVTAFDAMTGPFKIPGLGVSMGTKFLYFAGFEASNESSSYGPLIADEMVFRALPKMVRSEFRESMTFHTSTMTANLYAHYVEALYAIRDATREGWNYELEADQVEHWLWLTGKNWCWHAERLVQLRDAGQ